MAVTFVTAWKKNDPKLEADVIALWRGMNVLPKGESTDKRVKQIAILAYDDDRLAGISSLEVQAIPQLRQKFAFVRELIHPDYRKNLIARTLVKHTREMIEAYALAHPEEAIAGLAAVFQTPHLGKRAIGLESGMGLIGYTDKHEQIRAGWFEHFMVPANLTPPSEFPELDIVE
ncbi:MAG: hypothetical protein Q7T44_01335 [Parvibaculum sp.]|nr:hypothetical protein [Parvibaculum sp.]